MRSISRRRRHAAGIAAAVVTFACTSSTEPTSVASLSISPNPIVLSRGDSVQLDVSALDGQGHLVTGVAVTFSAEDTAIVAVTNTGRVRAREKGGTGVLVTGGGRSTLVPATVSAPIAQVLVAPSDTTLRPHQTAQLRTHVIDIDGDTVSGAPVVYSSDDVSVATVTNGGLVTATGAAGQAQITARSGFASGFSVITVPDTSIVAHLLLSERPFGTAVIGNKAFISRVDANRVQVLALNTRTFTDSFTVGSLPTLFALDSPATTAYLGNLGSQNVSIIDVASNHQTGLIPVHGDPMPVVLSPNDSMLFVTTNLDRLYKIDLSTFLAVDSLPLPATSHHLIAHPNDTLLYVATREGSSVLEVNWRTMTVARTFTVGGRTNGLILAPDLSELYVTNDVSNVLHVIRLSDGNVTNVPLVGGAYSVALDATGTRLYVGLLFAGKIQVLNRVARTTIKTIVTGGIVREMSLDAARNQIVVTNESGWVDIVR
jgi:YVTN family beta-propeller protein